MSDSSRTPGKGVHGENPTAGSNAALPTKKIQGPARDPAGAIADAVIEFLRGHPPFDHVEEDTLAALAAACRLHQTAI